MENKRNNDIRETVQILLQLDEKNLSLIDSGAKLLFARQKLDTKQEAIASDSEISK